MQKLSLTIDQMHCGHCVGRVTKALTGIAGVNPLWVGIGAADVEIDPARSSPQAVVLALTDAGYPSRIKTP